MLVQRLVFPFPDYHPTLPHWLPHTGLVEADKSMSYHLPTAKSIPLT